MGRRGHCLGTSPTLGLRVGGGAPHDPPECCHHTMNRTPRLTELYNQGQSRNRKLLKQT